MAKGKRGNPNWVKGGPSPNPDGGRKKGIRADTWENAASGHGTHRDRRMLTRYGVDIVTDREALNLWRSEWLAAKIIEKKPREIFRRGYEIKAEGVDPKKIAKVLTRAQELELDKRVVQAEEYRTAYGGAAIVAGMDGAVGEMHEPLDESHINAINAFHVLEPRELQPVEYYTDLNSPKFGQPSAYQLMPLTTGRQQMVLVNSIVHESRLAIFNGKRVSRQTQPGQRESWGDSSLSSTRQVLADYGLSWGSAATILHEFGHGVLEMDGFADLNATADGQAIIQRRMDWIAMAKSSLHAVVIDGKDKFSRANTSLSGLSDVLEQMAYVVAAAAGYPVSVLLDIVRGGLQTGDTSVRNWYAEIDNFRNTDTRPPLEKCLRWIMKSTNGPLAGNEPAVWSVAFRPLWEPSEKEVAETRKLDAETDQINIDKGVYSADDAAKSRHGGDTYGTKITIDWAAREAQQKIDEEHAAAMDKAALEAMGRGDPTPDPNAIPEGKPANPDKPKVQRIDEDGPGIGIPFAGLPVVVEHAKGTLRDGKYRMLFDYGYVVGLKGVDGDSLDVYLGGNEEAPFAYEVQQMRALEFTEPDEIKLMLGFDSANHARDAYIGQYGDPQFFGGIKAVPIDEIRARVGDAG